MDCIPCSCIAITECGNYTLQRVLAAASEHRSEHVNGESGFTVLVRSLCKDRSLAAIAADNKGTFAVQRMVSCPQECSVCSILSLFLTCSSLRELHRFFIALQEITMSVLPSVFHQCARWLAYGGD